MEKSGNETPKIGETGRNKTPRKRRGSRERETKNPTPKDKENIKIKKEKAEEEPKYNGTYKTPNKSTPKQKTLEQIFVDLTKTPSKRKQSDQENHPDIKKTKPRSPETQQNEPTETKENTETSPNETNATKTDRQKETSPNKKNPTTPNPKATIENPYSNCKTTSGNMSTPNPYQSTPTSSNREAPISYAQATSSQTKLRTHTKQRGKYNCRFEITFIITEEIQTEEQQLEQMRATLVSLLKRAKKVDRKSMINTWQEASSMRTIEKEQDIPFTPNDFKKYLNHAYTNKKINKGKNTNWRINIAMSIPTKLFVHYWEQSKHDFREINYVALKITPLQTKKYFTCGTFLNSSDGQITTQLEEGLSNEMKINVGCSFRSAPLDKRSSEEMWRHAYDMQKKGQGKVYKQAPLALNLYTETSGQARQVAKYMLDKYGRQDKDGQYPRLPDGSRMRFLPASRYLDMPGATTAKNLMKNQIRFNNDQIRLLLNIQDPEKRFAQHDNKTIGEMILDLKSPEMQNEPYFRHIVHKWTKDPSQQKYQVSIHGQMANTSTKMLYNLHNLLKEEYSQEVANEISTIDEEVQEAHVEASLAATSTLSLDTSDRYANGSATFIIEGMEALNVENNKPTLAEQKDQENDNYTMAVASEGTNRSQETSRTMDEVSKNNSTTTEARDSTAGNWTRVGTADAENQFRKTVAEKSNPEPDPGEDQGRQP